jgi:signal transduction histidine kinase
MGILSGVIEKAWLSLLTMAFLQPLHERIKASTDRLPDTARGTSNRMFKPLLHQLHQTSESHELLSIVAKALFQQLELPYVGVITDSAPERTQAHAGTPGVEVKRFPLFAENEPIGWLEVSFQPGEALNAEKQQILETLAAQVAMIVKSLQLTTELHVAQQQLVTTREEERRRLQRDLHDGLGSTLGAQTLIIGSARRLLEADPQRADQLLSKLETDMHGTLEQVRRLVYSLRPPELDQLGLTGALRLKLRGLVSGRLRLEFILPDSAINYPAAVEVAAYCIVTEAVSNVVRHAHARSCQVALKVTATGLEIEVTDDGRGFEHQRHGVGLYAMRERAEELGGELSVTSRQPTNPGIRIWASLPL